MTQGDIFLFFPHHPRCQVPTLTSEKVPIFSHQSLCSETSISHPDPHMKTPKICIFFTFYCIDVLNTVCLQLFDLQIVITKRVHLLFS